MRGFEATPPEGMVAMSETNSVNWYFLSSVDPDSNLYVTASPDGVNWGGQSLAIAGWWQTNQAISLAVWNDKVVMASVGVNQGIYIGTSIDGTAWPEPTRLWSDNKWQTSSSLALCAAGETLYVAALGLNGEVYVGKSTDGSTWSSPASIGKFSTAMPPSLASFKGKLYLGLVDANGVFNVASSTDGKQWSSPTPVVPTWWLTPCGVSLAALGDTLYAVIIGQGTNNIYLSTSKDGITWSRPAQIFTSFSTNNAVSLVAINNLLVFALVGLDQYPYVTSSSDGGTTWTSPAKVINSEWSVSQALGLTVGAMPAPTATQIAQVQTNITRMQTFNDSVHDYGQDKVTNAYLLLSEQDGSDPGMAVVVNLMAGGFAAIGSVTGVVGAFAAAFLSGMVSWWTSIAPPSLNSAFSSYLQRFSASYQAVDAQLASYSQDIAANWYFGFSWNGAGATLQSLSNGSFPPEDDPKFEKARSAALLALDQNLWTYILASTQNIYLWDMGDPIIINTDPTAWAQSFYAAHPAYYVTWAWQDGSGCGNESGWLIQEYNIGSGAVYPFKDGSISAGACQYLFIDSTPGTIINPNGLFTRAQVFTGLGIPSSSPPGPYQPRRPANKLSVGYLRAMKEGRTLRHLILREGREAVERRIIEKAHADSVFAADLRRIPRETLEKFLDVRIPEVLSLSVVVEDGRTFGLVIPQKDPRPLPRD
jgi:hypothetical protein